MLAKHLQNSTTIAGTEVDREGEMSNLLFS